jgi:hypothetical protein
MGNVELAKRTRADRLIGWLPLVGLTLAALAFFNSLEPWVFMWGLAISIYAGLKWLSWWNAPALGTPWHSLAYLLGWPGMEAEAFLDPKRLVQPPKLRAWFWAVFETSIGATLLWAVVRSLPSTQPMLRGWTGMVGLVLLLHFGSFQIVALFWQSLGICAMPIMSAPLRSRSLSEFWGKRWNLGFRQLSHDLIFGPLHRSLGIGATGFLVFIVSGLIHDLVISVPARGGYGLPTIYFALQGLGVTVERSSFGKQLGLRRGIRGWLFMAVFTLGPVTLLFHSPFVLRVIIPFMRAIHSI